jgi:hypothetical protein
VYVAEGALKSAVKVSHAAAAGFVEDVDGPRAE